MIGEKPRELGRATSEFISNFFSLLSAYFHPYSLSIRHQMNPLVIVRTQQGITIKRFQ